MGGKRRTLQSPLCVLILLQLITIDRTLGAEPAAPTHAIRGTFGQPIVGHVNSADHSVNAGFWATVLADSCRRPDRSAVYSNLSEVDFWWGTSNEFGDAVLLAPPWTTRTIAGVRAPLLNSNPGEWAGAIVLRFYAGTPDADELIFERMYHLVVPAGQSWATMPVPNVQVREAATCTIEGLPGSVRAAWNDAPTLGSSSDSYWVRDLAGPGSGWTQEDFGGPPSIANLGLEIVAFRASSGDADEDGIVDNRDVLAFVSCLDGPMAPSDAACQCGVDIDGDGHVDLKDFAFLQASFEGDCRTSAALCDDRNACTADSCNADVGGCEYVALTCNDGNACTVDRCNPDSGCVHTLASCAASDGCCPPGCSYANDVDCCRPQNAPCTSDSQCCSGRCRGAGTCH